MVSGLEGMRRTTKVSAWAVRTRVEASRRVGGSGMGISWCSKAPGGRVSRRVKRMSASWVAVRERSEGGGMAMGAGGGSGWAGNGIAWGAEGCGAEGSDSVVGTGVERAAWKRRTASGLGSVGEEGGTRLGGRVRGVRPEVSGRRLRRLWMGLMEGSGESEEERGFISGLRGRGDGATERGREGSRGGVEGGMGVEEAEGTEGTEGEENSRRGAERGRRGEGEEGGRDSEGVAGGGGISRGGAKARRGGGRVAEGEETSRRGAERGRRGEGEEGGRGAEGVAGGAGISSGDAEARRGGGMEEEGGSEAGKGEGKTGIGMEGGGRESVGRAWRGEDSLRGAERGRSGEEGGAWKEESSRGGSETGRGEELESVGGGQRGVEAGGVEGVLGRREERIWRDEGVSEARADWKRRMASGEGCWRGGVWSERRSAGRVRGVRPEVSGRRSAERERKEESMEMGVNIRFPPCGR